MKNIYNIKLISRYTGKERTGNYVAEINRKDKLVYVYEVDRYGLWNLMNPRFVRNFKRIVVRDSNV